MVDDYDLVALLPYLAQGRDLGLHVVARRVAGASRTAFEPVTSRLREVRPNGLILSGDRDQGPLIGNVRASHQPPGRGELVTRRGSPMLVQEALPARQAAVASATR